MEELNLSELLNYYLKKLPIIIGVTVVCILIGYFYTENMQVPMYHGSTTIVLVQKQEEDAINSASLQNEVTVNEKLVSTYSEIVKSRRVLNQVIDDLNLKMEVDELADKISVESVSETSIIKVVVSDKNNKKAVKIANKVANVFKKEIMDIYNLENVSIVDKAIIEDVPYNVSLVKQLAISGLVGAVLSCGIIFMVFYFDNTIKNKDEIEEKLGLAVLGEIPTSKKLRKGSNARKKVHKIEGNEFVIPDDASATKENTKKSTTKKTTKKKVTVKEA